MGDTMKRKSLVSYLDKLSDNRRLEGKRHNQTFILLLVLMATMSRHFGYRGIERFIKKNAEDLILHFKPKKDRLPSYATILRVVENIDFDEFSNMFKSWAIDYAKPEKGDLVSIDGKALKGTLASQHTQYQNFVFMVSAYVQSSNMVVGINHFENKKTSEIRVVEQLIEQLGLQGVTFTMDALHCQKNS